jgi:hypothetical protein
MTELMNRHGPTIATPAWAGDYRSRDHLVPGPFKLTASAFPTQGSVTVKLNGAVSIGGTTLTVDALSGPVRGGQILNFNGALALVRANAVATATSILVHPLTAAIADDSEAVVDGAGARFVPSGTVVGRTIAERNAGTGFGQPASTDDEVFITAFDVVDANKNDDVELYRPGSQVYENFLANYATVAADSALLAVVRARYLCTIGVP